MRKRRCEKYIIVGFLSAIISVAYADGLPAAANTPEMSRMLQALQQQLQQAATDTAAVTPPNASGVSAGSSQLQLAGASGLQSAPNATANMTTSASPTAASVPSPTDANTLTLNEQAFAGLVSQAMPLTPSQVMELHRLYVQSQQAATVSPVVPPQPVASTQTVQLAPGATPPVVRLAQGFVTSVVFVDATGGAWPIASYDLGDPKSFAIAWDNKSNILMIQSSTLFTYGNLAVNLVGLPTPVMITLIPGQRVVDYRVDMRIEGMGPNANPLVGSTHLPTGTSPLLLDVLDGVPPAGSKMLSVSGGAAEAWLINGQLYLRTRLTVLSPSWLSHVASSDGMQAYNMPTTPYVLASQQGQTITLKLEGL